MSYGRRHASLLVGVSQLIVAVALGTQCATGLKSTEWDDIAPKPELLTGQRPECPRSWDVILLRGQKQDELVAQSLPGGHLSVADNITGVPEFHDCQRFRLAGDSSAQGKGFNDGVSFGSLIAIFAASYLDSLPVRLARLRDTSTTSATSAAAALIYGVDGGYTHGRFHIAQEFNCLYMWRGEKADTMQWHAKIVPVGQHHEQCLKPYSPAEHPEWDLQVVVDSPREFGKYSDYPPVARWDWDETSKQQYIGIKCGRAWCQIGDPGFSPSPPYAVGATGAAARVVRIKGWYDEQYLAVENAAGAVVPSSVKGTIVPAPDLESRTVASYDHRWLPTAYVSLSGGTSAELTFLRTRYNFDPLPVSASLPAMNTLYLCHGTREDCTVPLPPSGPLQPSVNCGLDVWPFDGTPLKHWWIKTISPARPGTVMFHCVTRREHKSEVAWMPGTTRWRWLAQDETTWMLCDVGCCEKDNQPFAM